MYLTTEQRIYIGGLVAWGNEMAERYKKTSLRVISDVNSEYLTFQVTVYYNKESVFRRLTDNGACGKGIFDRKGNPSEGLKKSLSDIERFCETYHEEQAKLLQEQIDDLTRKIVAIREDRKAVKEAADVEL